MGKLRSNPPFKPSNPVKDACGNTVELMKLVYDELRALAAEYLKHERKEHTLQPTALVHEAYLRLAELKRIHWRDKDHFLAAAAGTIRRVLVDHARARASAKRGGGRIRISLSKALQRSIESNLDILELEDAMGRLSKLDGLACQIVELRFFGGLTNEKTARVLGLCNTATKEKWSFARVWLRRELSEDSS